MLLLIQYRCFLLLACVLVRFPSTMSQRGLCVFKMSEFDLWTKLEVDEIAFGMSSKANMINILYIYVLLLLDYICFLLGILFD